MEEIINKEMKNQKKKKNRKSVSRRIAKTLAKSTLYAAIFLGAGIAGDRLDLDRRIWQPIKYRNAVIEENTPKDFLEYHLEIIEKAKGIELYLVNDHTHKNFKIYKDGHTRRFPDELKNLYFNTKDRVESFLRKMYFYSKAKLEDIKNE